MKLLINPPRKQWQELCLRPQLNLDYLEGAVKNIMARVKSSGDEAIREFTSLLDKANVTDIRVSESEIQTAIKNTPEPLKEAIRVAAGNIEKFHTSQRREIIKIETTNGVTCWRKPSPISPVGIYIPGGSAPLFSTVLMLGIPARLAGCNEIVLCTPPDRSGKINEAVLYAANLVGIEKIFKVGGSQAIAAMGYGTESIPKVCKIFGPGNQYVTKAKQLISQEGVAIDMPAGPSEVLVLVDESANPAFAAADLLSQAEHGEDSQVVLIASSQQKATAIIDEVATQLEKLPRREIARVCLRKSLAIVLGESDDQVDFINEYAPEHLILNVNDCDTLIDKIVNAGSVFLGPFTPESAGDYASGTNHTLPTNGYAKAYGGVSLESFIKYITIQKISKEGIQNLSETIITMAEGEQLAGHALAVKERLKQIATS